MILRRFMKHVTDQNWFAVGLDVIVVITGIFLGMQVTEWNEERKENSQLTTYLNNTATDLKNSQDMWAIWEEIGTDTVAGLQMVIDGLDGNILTNEIDKHARRALFAAPKLFGIGGNKQTLIEMQNSGIFKSIEDDNLRQALNMNLTMMQTSIDYANGLQSLLTTIEFPDNVLIYGLNDMGAAVITNINWGVAKKNAAFREAVVQYFYVQKNYLWQLQANISLTQETLQMMEKLGYQPTHNWWLDYYDDIDEKLSASHKVEAT